MSFPRDFQNIAKIVCAFLLVLQFYNCLALVKFTNIQCFNLDANMSEFTLCRLRAVKRNVNELGIHVTMLQTPTTDISMRWQLMKKASGYKPFLYDVTVSDVCEYLEKRNHPFINIILNTFGNRSTGINKCPISNEIALDNFRFPENVLETLPLPFGEYGLFATFGMNGIDRSIVKIYFMLSEY